MKGDFSTWSSVFGVKTEKKKEIKFLSKFFFSEVTSLPLTTAIFSSFQNVSKLFLFRVKWFCCQSDSPWRLGLYSRRRGESSRSSLRNLQNELWVMQRVSGFSAIRKFLSWFTTSQRSNDTILQSRFFGVLKSLCSRKFSWLCHLFGVKFPLFLTQTKDWIKKQKRTQKFLFFIDNLRRPVVRNGVRLCCRRRLVLYHQVLGGSCSFGEK